MENKRGHLLLFWYECEAFQNLEWKPLKVLGVVETRDIVERRRNMTFEEFTDWQRQENNQLKEYARANGIQAEDARLHKIAKRIYKLYVAEDAKHLVPLKEEDVEVIENQLIYGTGRVHLGVFRSAQKIIFQMLQSEMFPAYLKSLSRADMEHMQQIMRDQPALATAMAFSGRRDASSFINAHLGAEKYMKANGRRPSIHIEPIVPDGAWGNEGNGKRKGPWICFLKK